MIAIVAILSALSICLAGLLIVALINISKYRARVHRMKDWAIDSPLPIVDPADVHPVFVPNKLGIAPQSEVLFVGNSERALGLTSEIEAWILAALAKHSSFMFEFGTATGRTAYLWARNSSPSARIVTITLHPDQHGLYKTGSGDEKEGTDAALRESAFSEFVYTGTDVASKVTQLFGDSKELDETPYVGKCDLVFVDGSHSYSYVKSDTEKAVRMIRPGGIILWHDYRNDHKHTLGVFQYLNELSTSMKLARIRNTSFVVYIKS